MGVVGRTAASASTAALNAALFIQCLALLCHIASAGRDTTAQALSWCVMLVSQSPSVQQRLISEVDACPGTGGEEEAGLLGSDSGGGVDEHVGGEDHMHSDDHHHQQHHRQHQRHCCEWAPTHESILKHLPYTLACMMETLRLYPSGGSNCVRAACVCVLYTCCSVFTLGWMAQDWLQARPLRCRNLRS